jgi:hypothetical protein
VLITLLKLRIIPSPCAQRGGEGVETGVKIIQCEAKVCRKAKTICAWERRDSNWHSERNMELEFYREFSKSV